MTPALLILLAVGAPSGTPEWSALQRRLAQDRLRVRFLRREELTIKQGIRELDREMKKTDKRIDTLADEADRTRDRIEELDRRITSIENRMGNLRETVGRRAAAMLRLRRTNLATILDHAVTPGDARRLEERLERVIAFDADLIRNVRDTSVQERDARDTLEAELTKLQETTDALEQENIDAALLREERAALLDAVAKERRQSGRLLADLLRASRRLKQELGVVRGARPAPERAEGGFSAQKGRLPWPVTGTVESIFGKTVDTVSGMVMVQRGIDIRAPQSALIRNVFDGRVAFAGRVEGLGRVLIVEHEGFHSIYAHLESFQVRKGQTVGQYQVLGFVGDSDSTKGAHLYFELREGREAVDPMTWLSS
ncbi:MAG: peptidoglycan DD-metalloendopeptidase family protein [Deltaproteobacteria bacterium]|jgi:septal ring factor EnvC (AmiA/AmiB activator)